MTDEQRQDLINTMELAKTLEKDADRIAELNEILEALRNNDLSIFGEV